jgi:hypothetical protein
VRAQELSSAPKERAVVRTKHRKKKLTVEEREVQRVEVARAEAEAKKMGAVSFRSLFGSDGLANPPVLLVDGYNVIFEARKSTGKAGTKLDGDLMDQYRRDLALNLDCFSHARGEEPRQARRQAATAVCAPCSRVVLQSVYEDMSVK